MPENLYPQLPTVPLISQGSFNIEMVRKYYQDIANIKEKYAEKQLRYKNAYNRLPHASTVQVLLLYLVVFQLSEHQSLLWDFL